MRLRLKILYGSEVFQRIVGGELVTKFFWFDLLSVLVLRFQA